MQTPTSSALPLDDRLNIVTPEGVELHLILAGLGSRFVASLIDSLLKSAVMYTVFLAAGSSLGTSGDAGEAGLFGVALGIILIFVLQSFYDIAFEVLAGGMTPGKRWSGLRVVMADGSPVTFRASAVRNIMRIVDFLPASFIAGIASILITQRNQRLGDLSAGTVVVRERKSGSTLPSITPSIVSAPTPNWDITAITPDEIAMVRAFLGRRTTLDATSRQRLGWELATRLHSKTGGVTIGTHPEVFLETVAALKAARR